MMVSLSGMSARNRLILFAVALALFMIFALALIMSTHPGLVLQHLSGGPDVVNHWH